MHLWAKKNNRIEIEPTKHQIFLQDQGEEIGLLAKEYLHKKIGVSHPDHEKSVSPMSGSKQERTRWFLILKLKPTTYTKLKAQPL
jgi:hypothetical protein